MPRWFFSGLNMFNCSPLPSNHLNHARITGIHACKSADIFYTCNQLITMQPPTTVDYAVEYAETMLDRKLGKRYLNTAPVIMNDIRSLASKMDELETLAWIQKEYKECIIMCFTETRPHKQIPDSHATFSGFHMVGGDGHPTASGKNTGGGLSTPDGPIWDIQYLCSSAIKLIAIRLRPYYLPSWV